MQRNKMGDLFVGVEKSAKATHKVDHKPITQFIVADEVLISCPVAKHVVCIEGSVLGERKMSELKPYTSEARSASLLEVGVNACQTGNYLYSTSFGPCQAVIARFSDGSFALYHAYFYHVDSLNRRAMAFLEDIRTKKRSGVTLDEIAVLEKTQGNKSNKAKAPLLAIALASSLDQEDAHKVKRIQVPDHTAVACNAVTGQVIIAMDLSVIVGAKGSKIAMDLVGRPVDQNQIMMVAIDESIADAHAMHHRDKANVSILSIIKAIPPCLMQNAQEHKEHGKARHYV